MRDYDEYEDDWDEDEDEDDWPEMDEEEKRLGFVPARYLCPEGEDWAYFGY